MELVNQFEPILSIEGRVEQLKQKPETQRAVAAMLTFMEKTSEYILERTKTGIVGRCSRLGRNCIVLTIV